MSFERPKDFATKALHVGSDPDPHTGAVVPALSLASTFAQKSPGVMFDAKLEYSRSGNPCRNNFEAACAAIEGAEFGIAFGSGSAALATIVHALPHGSHIVAGDDVYGGTNRFLRTVAIPQGYKVDFVPGEVNAEVEKAVQKDTALLWVESPTNPTMKISDIAALVKIAKAANPDCLVVVDNTFLSPYFQNPIALGADAVVHSVSKYINGHSDVVMGVVMTSNEEFANKLRYLQNAIGSIPGPFDCFMAHRGLRTLPVRMQRHEENAKLVAVFLEAHEKIERVAYPGLPSHPQHEIAKKQQSGYGGMMTFWLKGDIVQARQFLEAIHGPFILAESLGGIESLIEHPAIMTHASVPAERRKKLGISDSLVRVSVGIEHVDDIIADLKQALEKVVL